MPARLRALAVLLALLPAAPTRAAPTDAQLDNIVAFAEWTIGGAMEPGEKSQLRYVVGVADANPTFHRATVDVPPTDIGALYRIPANDQLAARNEALFGVGGLYVASVELAGLGDATSAYQRLADAILEAHRRIAGAAPLTDEQLAQAQLGTEALFGGKLLPAEAADAQAAMRTMFATSPKDVIELTSLARAMAAWAPAHTEAERTAAMQMPLIFMRGILGPDEGRIPKTPEFVAGARALLAAYNRLHGITATPAIPSLMPAPGKR